MILSEGLGGMCERILSHENKHVQPKQPTVTRLRTHNHEEIKKNTCNRSNAAIETAMDLGTLKCAHPHP